MANFVGKAQGVADMPLVFCTVLATTSKAKSPTRFINLRYLQRLTEGLSRFMITCYVIYRNLLLVCVQFEDKDLRKIFGRLLRDPVLTITQCMLYHTPLALF